jgi:hypothetical protein
MKPEGQAHDSSTKGSGKCIQEWEEREGDQRF